MGGISNRNSRFNHHYRIGGIFLKRLENFYDGGDGDDEEFDGDDYDGEDGEE